MERCLPAAEGRGRQGTRVAAKYLWPANARYVQTKRISATRFRVPRPTAGACSPGCSGKNPFNGEGVEEPFSLA
jgi:hypothetical protein